MASNGFLFVGLLTGAGVFAALFLLPWLAPLLHLLVIAGLGAGLVGAAAAVTGLGWGVSAACLVAAGAVLTLAVDLVRRVLALLH